MRFSILIGALMAAAVSAAPTPQCNAYTCQEVPPAGGSKPDVGPGDLIKGILP
ncbi:hypothetical protein LX32DRAFT_697307 [Colletotrichum zoysiae]|uniref:Uncharacterized protein n=1 Tax=Colletotrichum zoysiae TaxID=1216348 RepID=A0AAD9H851_9PEZI|nr:hypothetical protein LX32DRAFT_697307 [Colletotrichum zoysiae]